MILEIVVVPVLPRDKVIIRQLFDSGFLQLRKSGPSSGKIFYF